MIDMIKSSFCNLTSFKVRQNSVEVITPYSTINSKLVSVFITFVKDKIVITDSGWIDQNYYDTPVYEDSESIVNRTKGSFMASFNIKSTVDRAGVEYYYISCEKIEEVASCVFDLANFIVGVVNSFCIQYKDEREDKERETFRKEANDFLKAHYAEDALLRRSLDDFQTIKFNAIIVKKSNLFLLTYVTGSTQRYFENDLRKSIVNFEIAQRSKLRDNVKERIAILNDNSEGYLPERSSYILELLNEKTTRSPINWTEKEKILEII